MPTEPNQFFVKEIDFELALTELLTNHGWDSNVLVRPSEEDLLKNWANIIERSRKNWMRWNRRNRYRTKVIGER